MQGKFVFYAIHRWREVVSFSLVVYGDESVSYTDSQFYFQFCYVETNNLENHKCWTGLKMYAKLFLKTTKMEGENGNVLKF